MILRLLLPLLLAEAGLFAQADPAACKTGMLTPDYDSTQCTIGSLLFKFPRQTSSLANKTTVTPVAASPGGLQFSFMLNLPVPQGGKAVPESPDAVTPLYIAASFAIPFEVQTTTGTITQVTVAGDLGATKPPAVVSIIAKVGDPASDQVNMQLSDFSTKTNVFTKPVAAKVFLPVLNDFEAHSGTGDKMPPTAPVTISFTDTFTVK